MSELKRELLYRGKLITQYFNGIYEIYDDHEKRFVRFDDVHHCIRYIVTHQLYAEI